MGSLGFLVAGGVTLAAGVGVFVAWLVFGGLVGKVRAGVRQSLPLMGTVLLAAGVLAVVAGWLLSGRPGDRGEALKTGGLAAGSVVALYALWLNDRRRRVEEDRQELDRSRQLLETQRYSLEQRRQELDSARAEHDRERVADERFARAVELLGNSADQVRVGALHAMAGLARSRPHYTQTVLDVVCSYLRRPFDHPNYSKLRGDSTVWDVSALLAADQERQVRISAQRMISDLLAPASEGERPRYDLDLTGATLEYFDISDRVLGTAVFRVANLYESNTMRGAVVHGDCWFSGVSCWGRLHAQEVTFQQKAWFSGFHATDWVNFTGTRFLGETKFANSRFEEPAVLDGCRFTESVNFEGAVFEGGLNMNDTEIAAAHTHGMYVAVDPQRPTSLPRGWTVDESRGDAGMGLIRP